MAQKIGAAQLQEELKTSNPPRLLDVRRRADRELGPETISAAEWKDPEKIADWLPEMSKTGRTVVFCVRGGSVSQGIAEKLTASGLDVRFLEGGLAAWQSEPNKKE